MKHPPLGSARLAVRIYLVSVAAVLAVLLALFLALRLAWDPRRAFGRPSPGFSAMTLSRLWPAAPDLRAELERMRNELGQSGAVFRWDGTLVAASGEPLSPLSDEELRVLQDFGFMSHRCPGGAAGRGGPPGPCMEAFVIVPGRPPAGYALLAVGAPPPPFRELVPIGLTLVGLGLAAALLGRSLARPLQQLAHAAQTLGQGDLSARTGIRRSDELGEVARSFDEMADRLENLLRSQTELIANVAHELRTPLARIRVALDLAADGDAEVARSSLAEITEDLGELEGLVADVLASSRMELTANTARGGGAPPIHWARVDLEAVLRGAAERLSHRYPDRNVRLDIQSPLPPIDGDAVLLRRAVDNLLDNARKYSSPEALIQLGAAHQARAAVVQIVDHGEGIAPEDLAHLFTPFFRADRSRARQTGGVGLGLTLSRRIVEAHGGTLTAESVLGTGTTLTMTLPAATTSQPPDTGA